MANTASALNDFSVPIPAIGLYIAGATMVCFLFMICDVIDGVRSAKTWLPCRLFSLNSVTLSLLGIATKITVDLTTAMPSALDQLSKLTGTAFICISMGFMFPSLGINRASESVTNMIALSIFVVTVVVNISIQMATGVIFSFIVEHVIVMYFMLMMLVMLWLSTSYINGQKEFEVERQKGYFQRYLSILLRLKVCYLNGRASNPQLLLCKSKFSLKTSLVSSVCLITVLEATFRSLVSHEFKRWNGLSDYRWSMSIIVGTQVLAIVLATVVTGFRSRKDYWHKSRAGKGDPQKSRESNIFFLRLNPAFFVHKMIVTKFPYLKGEPSDYLSFSTNVLMQIALLIMELALLLPTLLVTWVVPKLLNSLQCSGLLKEQKQHDMKEYRHHLHVANHLGEWTMAKCAEDIKRWTNVSEKYTSTGHIRELFLKTSPSQPYLENNKKGGSSVSSIHLVLLVRIASVSMPNIRSRHLTECLSQVFDIVHFIDTKINFLSPGTKHNCRLAKAMWIGKDISTKGSPNSQSDLGRALEIIQKLKKEILSPNTLSLWSHSRSLINSITRREYTTIEELYDYIETLFVKKLHILLCHLPCVIYKEVTECSVEDFEETTRLMLKFVCQVLCLEDVVQWSFPDGSGIVSLTEDEVPSTDHHNNVEAGGKSSNIAKHTLGDTDHQNNVDMGGRGSNADTNQTPEDEDCNGGNTYHHGIIQI